MRFPFDKHHTQFPPVENAQAQYAMYDAFYAGDPARLHRAWGTSAGATANNAFWSTDKPASGTARLHVPLASDIASTSSNLLFAQMPDVTIPEADEGETRAVQAYDRLKEILTSNDFLSTLLEAGETASALGGVFLKPVWDKDLADYPLVDIVQPDFAIPEFKWNLLTAVTFWSVIKEENHGGEKKIYRLFERHAMENKKSVIYSSIHCGKADEIGEYVSPATMPGYEDLQERIVTGYDSIMARYIPNVRPNRLMRGSSLGQSDLAGAEHLLDAIDEVYSSLMRDIRLAKARLIVPEAYLDFESDLENKTTRSKFDTEKALFSPINADPMLDKNANLTATQFSIRMEEHVSTILDLIERVVTHAGYSPQTFGLKIEGAESGTALHIRERNTYVTRQKKWRHWATAIEDIMKMLLFVDNVMLGNKTPINYKVSVSLDDNLDRDLGSLANSIRLLFDAQAISIDAKVRMLHPEWDEEQILAEIEAIRTDYSLGASVDGLTAMDDALDNARLDPTLFGAPGSEDTEEQPGEDSSGFPVE